MHGYARQCKEGALVTVETLEKCVTRVTLAHVLCVCVRARVCEALLSSFNATLLHFLAYLISLFPNLLLPGLTDGRITPGCPLICP